MTPTPPYGDGETFEFGGAIFRTAMRMCDDCDASGHPLAWFGRYVRICEECRDKRVARDDTGDPR